MNEIPFTHEKFMARCLQLAAYGAGFVAPNPLVGAVIVWENQIIGEGFHRKFGQAHAEVNAVSSVKDKKKLQQSILYVNLEPCFHHGKTPPCVDLIIAHQIPRVVIGHSDPFPAVAGKGIECLRQAGIDVQCGILEKECRILNRRFLTFVQKKRPYVILKWAQSNDGFMDQIRFPGDGKKAVKFSNAFTQMLNHKLRSEEAAILVGKNTEILDNPSLNVRFWTGNDPIKFIASERTAPAVLLDKMYQQGMQSVIVEGGARLLHSFIEEKLWDEARIEVAPVSLKTGVKAPFLEGKIQHVENENDHVYFSIIATDNS